MLNFPNFRLAVLNIYWFFYVGLYTVFQFTFDTFGFNSDNSIRYFDPYPNSSIVAECVQQFADSVHKGGGFFPPLPPPPPPL
jgi:hypothetical protein